MKGLPHPRDLYPTSIDGPLHAAALLSLIDCVNDAATGAALPPLNLLVEECALSLAEDEQAPHTAESEGAPAPAPASSSEAARMESVEQQDGRALRVAGEDGGVGSSTVEANAADWQPRGGGGGMEVEGSHGEAEPVDEWLLNWLDGWALHFKLDLSAHVPAHLMVGGGRDRTQALL